MAKSASHGRAPMGTYPGDYGTHTMLAITNDTITWAPPQPLTFSSHHPFLPSVLLSPSLGCSLSRFISLFSSLNLFFSISYTHITPHGVCSTWLSLFSYTDLCTDHDEMPAQLTVWGTKNDTYTNVHTALHNCIHVCLVICGVLRLILHLLQWNTHLCGWTVLENSEPLELYKLCNQVCQISPSCLHPFCIFRQRESVWD